MLYLYIFLKKKIRTERIDVMFFLFSHPVIFISLKKILPGFCEKKSPYLTVVDIGHLGGDVVEHMESEHQCTKVFMAP